MRIFNSTILFLLTLTISCKSMEISPNDDFSLYLEDLKSHHSKGLFNEGDNTFNHGDIREFSLKVENNIRRIIPLAGNQIQDIRTDSLAAAKSSITRLVNTIYFNGDIKSSRIEDVLKTATTAQYFEGGLCNEYSAVTFANLMLQDLDEPIVRLWSTPSIHSFTSIGDPRESKSGLVVDPWTIKRDPTPYKDTRMSLDINPNVVNVWKQRNKGEGKIIIQDHNEKMKNDYFHNGSPKCLDDPFFLTKMKLCWDVSKQSISNLKSNYKINANQMFDIETNRLEQRSDTNFSKYKRIKRDLIKLTKPRHKN